MSKRVRRCPDKLELPVLQQLQALTDERCVQMQCLVQTGLQIQNFASLKCS